ncbi:GNAT family N-acetyltransferase [Alteromonadaceae bacterium BrNp21-10]|nr:GNAT family N-acetyltransferase [Alteromonadaceae bacterium BrNp21-10]
MKALCGYNVALNPIQQTDLEMIRQWRNSPAVSQFMLSQEDISTEQQQAWFNKLQRDNTQQHWLICYKQQPIGCANIKACYQGQQLSNAQAIEVGLYIADERYRGNIVAFAPTLLVNDYCFEELATKQLLAVVKNSNQAALNYNEKLGYKVQQRGELLKLTLTAKDYQQATVTIKQFLSR